MTAPPNKLLVEGSDDYHVVCNLMMHYAIPDVFKVKQKDGISNLLETIEMEFEESGLLRMGIMVDADIDLAGRWQSLQQHIHNLGFQNVPVMLNPQGTILRQEGLPSLGLWIMPDNRVNGMLEDFVGYLVPDEDRILWDHAGTAIDSIPAAQRRFSDAHRSKAHIHTWLAWQEEPGKPMGQAITARYLNPTHPSAQVFVNWIRNLFEIH